MKQILAVYVRKNDGSYGKIPKCNKGEILWFPLIDISHYF